jgi:aminocarboxymuconate-semialdehyde decarboxylase
MTAARRIVDSQWHWYPRAFFEDVANRSAFPRCDVMGDEFRLELAPGQRLGFPIAECELDAQMALMDAAGVATAIVSPGSVSVEAFGPDDALRLAKLLNTQLASAQELYPTRIVGAATIPFTSPSAALEVLSHAVGELGLRVAWLPSNALGELIDVVAFEPLFERMEALGTVGLLHPVRTMMADKLSPYGLEYIVGFPVETSLVALALVLGAVLERLPELKLLHPHLGGVLPYLAGRVDREYRNPWAGNVPLPHPPSTYLRRFYTDTVSESAEALALAIDFYGVEHVLFASDHPWWPVDAGIDFVRRNTQGVVTDSILASNADTLFGLHG